MRIAIAQINPTIGDFAGNVEKICAFIGRAEAEGGDLVIFPEMAVSGYPPRDLLERGGFVDANLRALDSIKAHTANIAVIVGFVDRNTGKKGKPLYNAAAYMRDCKIQSRHYKTLLPSYDVFDEDRYFEPARSVTVVEYRRLQFGITVCEDIWNPDNIGDTSTQAVYHINPVEELLRQGAQFIINLSASPFESGKVVKRRSLVANLSARHKVPFIYVNQVGGNDDLVFDGNSVVANAEGDIVEHGCSFEEDLFVVDMKADGCRSAYGITPQPDDPDEIKDVLHALLLGLRDYVSKCGFRKVVLGLSGGIDSAVVAVIARMAVGSSNVLGVAMPSVYSSDESLDDAQKLAHNLGINFKIIPIEEIHTVYTRVLKSEFDGMAPDITEENLQARMRGNIIMALSNKFGYLVLTTGNKSELAVGYCTMYGDMCGGLAVISDVPKMMVYELANHINAAKEIIPVNTIEKAPSAELRPDQKDQDSLPPYTVLDGILKAYVEDSKTVDEIVDMFYDETLVREIIKRVDGNEYKRKQAAPGLKITSKAFGTGRRIPIAHAYNTV